MARYNRQSFLGTIGLALTMAFIPYSVSAKESSKGPNVLFIAIDDMRPELGCYGYDWIQSPNIDRLAARGTVFNRAYCQAAVCGASRASIFTGLRPTKKRFTSYRTYAEKDAPNASTIFEAFKKNGYHCISNGKIFHHKNDTNARSWSEPAWKPEQGGGVYLDPQSKKLANEKGRGPVFESPDVPDNAYADGQIAEKTILDLKRMKEEGTPFFLACGFMKPHLPFYAPKKYWDLYDRSKISVADNQYVPKNASQFLKGSTEISKYPSPNIEYNSDGWHRSCRHGYYACVSYVDTLIGNVLETLDELELRDNTIIVIWGDHGWHLGEHNFWGKHNAMHLAIRVPLIISAPGYQTGQTSDRLVELVDLYPTLCDLAGISPLSQELEGTSMQPLLSQPKRPWKKAVFSKYGPGRNVITERYNFIQFKEGETMLFDLEQDPDENISIAHLPESKELVSQFQKTLEAGWESVLPQPLPPSEKIQQH